MRGGDDSDLGAALTGDDSLATGECEGTQSRGAESSGFSNEGRGQTYAAGPCSAS